MKKDLHFMRLGALLLCLWAFQGFCQNKQESTEIPADKDKIEAVLKDYLEDIIARVAETSGMEPPSQRFSVAIPETDEEVDHYLSETDMKDTNITNDEKMEEENTLISYRLFEVIDSLKIEEEVQTVKRNRQMYFHFKKNLLIVPLRKYRLDQFLQTLIHEIYHWFQAHGSPLGQSYAITNRRDIRKDLSADGDLAFKALIEGDADLIKFKMLYQNNTDQLYSYMNWRADDIKDCSKVNLWQYLDYIPQFWGMRFMLDVWKNNLRDYAYSDKFPASTEQILHFEKFIAGEKPLRISENFFDQTINMKTNSSYEVGEAFLRYILCVGDVRDIEHAASGWGGSRVWLNLDNVLVHLTVWDTVKDAEEFLDAWKTRKSQQSQLIHRQGKYTLVLISDNGQVSLEQIKNQLLPAIPKN